MRAHQKCDAAIECVETTPKLAEITYAQSRDGRYFWSAVSDFVSTQAALFFGEFLCFTHHDPAMHPTVLFVCAHCECSSIHFGYMHSVPVFIVGPLFRSSKCT